MVLWQPGPHPPAALAVPREARVRIPIANILMNFLHSCSVTEPCSTTRVGRAEVNTLASLFDLPVELLLGVPATAMVPPRLRFRNEFGVLPLDFAVFRQQALETGMQRRGNVRPPFECGE